MLPIVTGIAAPVQRPLMAMAAADKANGIERMARKNKYEYLFFYLYFRK